MVGSRKSWIFWYFLDFSLVGWALRPLWLVPWIRDVAPVKYRFLVGCLAGSVYDYEEKICRRSASRGADTLHCTGHPTICKPVELWSCFRGCWYHTTTKLDNAGIWINVAGVTHPRLIEWHDNRIKKLNLRSISLKRTSLISSGFHCLFWILISRLSVDLRFAVLHWFRPKKQK